MVFETYKAVRGAVEAISANFVLCSKIEGEGVGVVLLWYRRVKGRVKHRHVGAGEQLLGLSDPDQIRRIVEGGKPRCIINRILHCLVHNDRAVEAVGAVHHTMADNADIRRVLRITIGRRGLASEIYSCQPPCNPIHRSTLISPIDIVIHKCHIGKSQDKNLEASAASSP